MTKSVSSKTRKPIATAWILSTLGLLFICWLGFLWNLGRTGLVDETEPLFAEAARQMTLTGDWITPYFNGETRFDKPPLVYWLMAVGYQVIGVNSWAVRLPSALAATGLTVGCFLTLKNFGWTVERALKNPDQNSRAQYQSWIAAWLGAILVTFNLETLVWARQGVSDMLLSGCMGGGLLCFFWGYVRQTNLPESKPAASSSFLQLLTLPNRGYLAFYLLTGLAVLAKGPVGIVLPGLVLFSFLLYTQNFWQVLREMKLLSGTLIFLAITVPWYILVTLRNGQAYIDSFFGYHNFERFTQVVNEHSAPWYFYFLVILAGFFPGAVYLPIAIVRLRLRKVTFWRARPRSEQLGIFAFFWFISIFGFFSASATKLPSYVLPLMPAAAILVALFWSEIFVGTLPRFAKAPDESIHKFSHSRRLGVWLSILVNLFCLVLLGILFFISPELIGHDPAVVNLPQVIRQSALQIRAGVIWLIAAVGVTVLFRDRSQWRWILIVNLTGFLVFFVGVFHPALFLIDQMRQLPLREISTLVPTVKRPNEEILMVGFKKPSVAFYSQQSIQFFEVRNFFKGVEPGRPLYYLYDAMQNRPQPTSILVISREKDLQKLNLTPENYQALEQQGRYQLIRIEKKIIVDRVRSL
ncbi:MAG: ArnT family glycosyltransferase [Microcoleaceae cyanobacterium]